MHELTNVPSNRRFTAVYVCIPCPDSRLEVRTRCSRPLNDSSVKLHSRGTWYGAVLGRGAGDCSSSLHLMQDSEAGPGPGSAASRADERSNLHIRFVLILIPAGHFWHEVKALNLSLYRTLLCERGLLQRADGSARWCQDKTCVLAAIYGPRSTLGRKEDPEQAVVEVVFKPKSGVHRYNAPGVSLLAMQLTVMGSTQSYIGLTNHGTTARMQSDADCFILSYVVLH